MVITQEMVQAAQQAYDTAPSLGWMFNQPKMYCALEAALKACPKNMLKDKLLNMSENEKQMRTEYARVVYENTSDYSWLFGNNKMHQALEKALETV
jgi:phage pi2 protein 07